MIIIVALVLIGVSVVIAGWQRSILSGKRIAMGTVTALEPHSGSKGGRTWSLVAEFRDDAGAPFTYRSGWSSSNPGYGVGDPIAIYYRQDDPAANGLASFGARYGAAFLFAYLGIALGFGRFLWLAGERLFAVVYLPS